MLWVERQVIGAVILIAVVMMVEVFPLCVCVCVCVCVCMCVCEYLLQTYSSPRKFLAGI